MRLHAQTATIENGFVHLPETAHWLADYLHELTMFPAGRYDDQVDSTAQALAWTKIRPPGWDGANTVANNSNGRMEPSREPQPPSKRHCAYSMCVGSPVGSTWPQNVIVIVVEEDATTLPSWRLRRG
jgi:hypothetical protein